MREYGFRYLLATALMLFLLPLADTTSAQVTADTSDAAQAVLSRLERSAQGRARSLQAGRDGLEKMRQSLKVDGKSYAEERCLEVQESILSDTQALLADQAAWCAANYPELSLRRNCINAGGQLLQQIRSAGFCPGTASHPVTPPSPAYLEPPVQAGGRQLSPALSEPSSPGRSPAYLESGQIFDSPRPGRLPTSSKSGGTNSTNAKTGPKPSKAAPSGKDAPGNALTTSQAASGAPEAKPAGDASGQAQPEHPAPQAPKQTANRPQPGSASAFTSPPTTDAPVTGPASTQLAQPTQEREKPELKLDLRGLSLPNVPVREMPLAPDPATDAAGQPTAVQPPGRNPTPDETPSEKARPETGEPDPPPGTGGALSAPPTATASRGPFTPDPVISDQSHGDAGETGGRQDSRTVSGLETQPALPAGDPPAQQTAQAQQTDIAEPRQNRAAPQGRPQPAPAEAMARQMADQENELSMPRALDLDALATIGEGGRMGQNSAEASIPDPALPSARNAAQAGESPPPSDRFGSGDFAGSGLPQAFTSPASGVERPSRGGDSATADSGQTPPIGRVVGTPVMSSAPAVPAYMGDEDTEAAVNFDPARTLGVRNESIAPSQRFEGAIPNFTGESPASRAAQAAEQPTAFTVNRGPAAQRDN